MRNINTRIVAKKPTNTGYDANYNAEYELQVGKHDNSISLVGDGEVTTIAVGVLTGDGAPSITPNAIGQQYIDTTNKIGYLACGSTSSDWKQITN